jgi:signal transduction histidine kinase
LHASLVSSAISLLAVTLFSGLVIVVGGVRMVGRPLNQLIDKIHRVGAGDFSGPVEIEGHDELGRLGIALNQMCTELESQREQLKAETARRVGALQQLRHADRLNTVGRLAAGVAHELGTPLSVVAGRAELIVGGQLSEEAIRQSADVIKQESERIAQTIRLLLDFARRRTPQRQATDLRGLVQETVNLLTAIASKQGVTLEVSAPSAAVSAEVDSGQLQQVLTNLVLNAIQATSGTPGERRVEVRVRAEADRRGIEVRDTGTGIAPEDREHLFEPFFTTKDVGEGTGLGLSISEGIIREHDGTIEVTSELGKGSQFAIWLPAPPAGPSTYNTVGFSS